MPLPPSEAYPEWGERGRRDSAGEESAVGAISKIQTPGLVRFAGRAEAAIDRQYPAVNIKAKISKATTAGVL